MAAISLIASKRMRNAQLAKRLARQSGISRAEAADRLDKVVNRILSNLRKGEPASFPGLGEFTPGRKWDFRFQKEHRSRERDGESQ